MGYTSSFWSSLIILMEILTSLALATFVESSSTPPVPTDHYSAKNCYAIAVYYELKKAIDIINSRPKLGPPPSAPIRKKFQEDEDDGLPIPPVSIPGTDIEFTSLVPMIFKIVGSALTLNSSAVVENSLGFIPERVSNQITNALESLANSILGTKPTTPPSRRRRRTTTTMKPTEAATTESTSPSVLEGSNNETESTNLVTNEPTSTTTEVLFKESSLGELPVYAAAYAPNYIATTSFPVYASNFLHVLYPAPTTTTTTTTTTEEPGSFGVSLPFDYQVVTEVTTVINKDEPNSTDYAEDYDYEEDTKQVEVKQGRRFPNRIKLTPLTKDDEYKDS